MKNWCAIGLFEKYHNDMYSQIATSVELHVTYLLFVTGTASAIASF